MRAWLKWALGVAAGGAVIGIAATARGAPPASAAPALAEPPAAPRPLPAWTPLDPPPAGQLRVLTLNLWGPYEPLARRLELVAFGLSIWHPDVVCLQEVAAVPGSLGNTADVLARRAGFADVFCPATTFPTLVEGVAILTRDPVLASESAELPGATPAERRVVLLARCRTPAGPVNVYTTHLNHRAEDGATRAAQVRAVDEFVAGHRSALPQVLAGDFNAAPTAPEIRFLRGELLLEGRRTYWEDAFAELHPEAPGWTWAGRNPLTARSPGHAPDRRIDYVFAAVEQWSGQGLVRACRLVFDEPDADGVFASDHFGVLADVQLVGAGLV